MKWCLDAKFPIAYSCQPTTEYGNFMKRQASTSDNYVSVQNDNFNSTVWKQTYLLPNFQEKQRFESVIILINGIKTRFDWPRNRGQSSGWGVSSSISFWVNKIRNIQSKNRTEKLFFSKAFSWRCDSCCRCLLSGNESVFNWIFVISKWCMFRVFSRQISFTGSFFMELINT